MNGAEAYRALMDPANDNRTVDFKRTWSAGALYRKAIRNAVEEYCDWHSIQYTIKEYKGWLQSDYLLTATGTTQQIRGLVNHLEAIAKAVS